MVLLREVARTIFENDARSLLFRGCSELNEQARAMFRTNVVNVGLASQRVGQH